MKSEGTEGRPLSSHRMDITNRAGSSIFRVSEFVMVVTLLCILPQMLTAQGWKPETLHAFAAIPATPNGRLAQTPDGAFLGVSRRGGKSGQGTVFQMFTNGQINVLASFVNTNGADPVGGLVLGPDGCFYGTTRTDGLEGYGTVFKVTTNGLLTVMAEFSGTNGSQPLGELTLGDEGQFYGTTFGGGEFNAGTVFRLTTNGVIEILVSFNWANGGPYGPTTGLAIDDNDAMYGKTRTGVYRVTTNGVITAIGTFSNTSGTDDYSGDRMVFGPDRKLYDVTSFGGDYDLGSLYRVGTNGGLETLVSLFYTNGVAPLGGLTCTADGTFFGTASYGGDVGKGVVFRFTTGGVFSVVAEMTHCGTNGASPNAPLVVATDGNLYGTTALGGINGMGTVYRVTLGGQHQTLVSFNRTNGSQPLNGLTRADDNSFYGTTTSGGEFGYGTAFRVTTNGALSTLVSFNGTNGATPWTSLLPAIDGSFYGVTASGGAGFGGTIFRITTNGSLTTLVNFSPTNNQGAVAPFAGLTIGPDHNLYGVTMSGGSNNAGTVFRVTTNGAVTILASFVYFHGAQPMAELTLANDGYFYGTTGGGGQYGYGTVFRLNTNGVLTTLHSFDGTNGAGPQAKLLLARDGYLYGSTTATFFQGAGNMFRVRPSGEVSILHTLDLEEGAAPRACLATGSDGNLYGTTSVGGPLGGGTVFRITLVEFTNISSLPDGSISLSGIGPTNQPYRLWTSANSELPTPSWSVLRSNSFSAVGRFFETDTNVMIHLRKFYRLSAP